MITKVVKCPNCKKDTQYSVQNQFRPFCSERCRLIDLGDWASEKYSVPAVNKNPDNDIPSTQNANPSIDDE